MAKNLVDDTKEFMSTFQENIATAQANKDEWVETTPEIIKTLQPRGLNGAKYFIYHGIKVCEYGAREAIERELHKTPGQILHGEDQAEVVSG